METNKPANYPKVYIYPHPDRKQFLFSPELLETEIKCIRLNGLHTEAMEELFSHEKDAVTEGWYSGPSVQRFMDGLYEQAARENIGSEFSDMLLQNGITTLKY